MEPLLRIELTELMLQQLIWLALASPDALVMTSELNKAIEKQQEEINLSLEGYQVTSVSVTTEAGKMYAELSYSKLG